MSRLITTKRVLFLAALLLLSVLVGAGAAQDKIVLRFSTVSVPNDAHTVALYTFERVLEASTNGQIQVEVYPQGKLYTQEGVRPAIRRGDVEMTYTGPNWLADEVPYMSMFAAGYIFRNYEHMTKTLNGPIGQSIYDDIAEKTNVRPLGAFYLGTRELNLRDIGRRVEKPEDLKGVKLRMPNTPTWLFLGKALGADPTPVSFTELYMALKTGTVDGQDNPLPTDYNAKFYEVTKYIILTDHFVNPIMPAINEDVWQSLSPELQQKVHEAIDAARYVCDQMNLNAEARLLDFFKEQGMTIIKPDKQAFREHVLNEYLNSKYAKDWDMELYKQVQELGEKLAG